jgi:hypothetical protein
MRRMTDLARASLDRPAHESDDTLGPAQAPITLVESGSYACRYAAPP